MEDVKIKLSALWVARMLVGFLGDVLRIYDPRMTHEVTHEMLLVSAIIFVLPIVMVYLSLTLKDILNRWANIIIATFLFGLDFIGLFLYNSAYMAFLVIVGLAFNVLTVWHAWNWSKQED